MELKEQFYQNILQMIRNKLQVAVKEGTEFYSQILDFIENTELGRTEFARGCRYLHRGYYCPSPDRECMTENVRRGKIVKRHTKASSHTNFYMFDENDNLFLAETVYPNGAINTEYIFSKGTLVYGFSYDKLGRIYSISIEEKQGQQRNYLCAYCTGGPEDYSFINLVYENINIANGLAETDLYSISDLEKPALIFRNKATYETDSNGDLILNSRELLLDDQYYLQ